MNGCVLYISELLSIGGGTDSHLFPKQPGKVIGILKSTVPGNGSDGEFRMAQQILTVPQTDFGDVLMQGFAGMLPKQVIQIIAVITKVLCNVVVAGNLSITAFDMFPDFFHQGIPTFDMGLISQNFQNTQLQQRGAEFVSIERFLPSEFMHAQKMVLQERGALNNKWYGKKYFLNFQL